MNWDFLDGGLDDDGAIRSRAAIGFRVTLRFCLLVTLTDAYNTHSLAALVGLPGRWLDIKHDPLPIRQESPFACIRVYKHLSAIICDNKPIPYGSVEPLDVPERRRHVGRDSKFHAATTHFAQCAGALRACASAGLVAVCGKHWHIAARGHLQGVVDVLLDGLDGCLGSAQPVANL